MDKNISTTNEPGQAPMISRHRARRLARQLLFFLATVAGFALLLLLLRLLKSVIAERRSARPEPFTRETPSARLPVAPPAVEPAPARPSAPAAPQAAQAPSPPPSRRKASRPEGAQPRKKGRARAKRRSWSRVAEKALLATEVVAIVLFLVAGVALWNTLRDLNDTYRTLQQTDPRILPTVIPAANPGLLPETVAQRARAEELALQEPGILPPFNSVPAPALPTPFPTSTPAPVLSVVSEQGKLATSDQSQGAGAVPEWGTTAVMAKPATARELSRRIQIPTIDVDSFVYQNYGQDWLKLGVVQYGESVSPGQPGNLVLAAHNDVYGEIFRDLDQLERGEEVTIFSDYHAYTYRVRDVLLVEPDETWVMLPTSSPMLTLISCYPYLLDTERIVVFADLVQ